MKNEVSVVDIEEKYEIEKSRAEEIEKVFSPMVKMLKGFEEEYNEIVKEAEEDVTQAVTAKAKRLRLDIRKVRTTADKAHSNAKAEALRWGRAIDGVRNILKYAVEEKEEKLQNIENHFENIEKERIEKLQRERETILVQYEMDIEGMQLGEMTEQAWQIFAAGVKTNFEAKKEAERKAEEDRIAKEKAEAEERKRIEEENKKLKAEAEIAAKKAKEEEAKRQKELESERKKAEAERKKLEAEKAAERKKAEAAAEKARKEKEKLEKELEAKRQAEEKAKEKAEEEEKAKKLAEQKAKRAPDKDKLISFTKVLKELDIPSVKSEEAKKIADNTKELINKVIKYVADNAAKL